MNVHRLILTYSLMIMDGLWELLCLMLIVILVPVLSVIRHDLDTELFIGLLPGY